MTPARPPRRSALPDVAGGLMLLAIGAFFLAGAFRYGIGTVTDMGPGYFPMLLGAATCALAAVVTVSALIGRAQAPDAPAWRPFLCVSAGIAAFGATIASLGLLPAAGLAVILAGLADRGARLGPTLALAAVVCLGSWLVFTVGLGLPMPLVRFGL